MNIQSLAAALALGVAMGLAAPSSSFAAEFEAAAKPKPESCEKKKKACKGDHPSRELKQQCEAQFKRCKLDEHCVKHPREKKCRPVSN